MELELISKNQELINLNTKLESINIDLEQFTYATSHDLQEPLRMIGSFAQLIARRYKGKINGEINDYIDFIVEEYFEWFTFDLSKEKPNNKKYSLLTNLYSLDYKYDADYWKNKVLAKINKKVISDLNTFKDLEEQFIND